MTVREIMSREVRTISPDSTLQEAALLMRQVDIGALLVSEGDQLIGMVTDRDLVVRGLADALATTTPVNEVMSAGVCYCFEDETVDHVSKNMAQIQKRRLAVVNREKRLVGILSLANVASCNAEKLSANLLRSVARPH
ncbi:CBS domain-containing protein [Pseudomonas sp. ZM23]|uniref:CBS domain-containing protein n=1 Tax=Pseudomonas triclosanedens TaxID=2961893 RepID=A0ABY7A5G2_9PSED|nr:CBS domain-containing protein [Pseudomonas triclosanedens]MCP8467579.1 CBS domain-containing protein [Pseudomonas triclosanedens]MCP8471756.1 CBS domain-containing protein [Pseudomonas triclosanedens]MCP8478891.1 CBS domain-containing protein [Pseudomonas triclosanedens]WAI52489.1 CBS domain-containing protein [Pseudomonas triclosanedens]